MTQKRIPVRLILESFHEGFDDEKKAVLDSWLEQPGNRSVYEGIRNFWKKNRTTAENYLPDKDYLWNELNDRIRVEKKRGHKKVMSIVSLTTSIAAALILGAFLFQPISDKLSGQDRLATISALSGETRTALPDGTRILISDGSSINYDLRKFDKKERHVTLSGKAMFDVSKNPEKPFTVNVDKLQIRVTGTRFLVDEQAEEILVSLKEGAVIMKDSKGTEFPMVPGDVTEYDKISDEIQHLASGIPSSIVWNKDRLSFTRNDMGEICNALSQWYGIPIKTTARLADSFAYTFMVTDEPVEEILDFICRINHLDYQKVADGSYLIK